MGLKPRPPRRSRRLIAFLRAINVGGRTVTKDRLVRAFAAAGVRDAETFIASGNIAFDAVDPALDSLEHKIAGALRDECGYEVATFVRSIDQIRELAARHPFGALDRAPGRDTLYIAFTSAPVGSTATASLDAHRSEVDHFRAHGAHVYWLRRLPNGESKFSSSALERALAAPCTLRNMNTLDRLVARYGD